MRVEQIKNNNGRAVPNQFIIHTDENELSGNSTEVFQSYDSIICRRERFRAGELSRLVTLDPVYWNYSRTTSRYRSLFLGEDTKTTQKKIDSGEYVLANLN